MKFDYCIGNPPYHYEAGRRKIPIYQHFMMTCTKGGQGAIARYCCFVTPDGFIKGGQQLEGLRNFLIETKHLKSVEFHKDKLFQNIAVDAAITFFDNESTTECITKKLVLEDGTVESGILDWYYRDVVIDDLKYKVLQIFETKVACNDNMSLLVPGRSPCGDGFSSKCFKKNKNKFARERESTQQHKVLVNEEQEYYYVYLDDNFNFINDSGDEVVVKLNLKNINMYKVSFAKAGSVKNAPLKTRILEPGDIFIDKFLCIYADSLEVAKNIEKYFNSKFYRAGLDSKMTSWNIVRPWHSNIPIQDFTNNSDIDWSKSPHEIDLQLYHKYNFTQEEIELIEEYIK